MRHQARMSDPCRQVDWRPVTDPLLRQDRQSPIDVSATTESFVWRPSIGHLFDLIEAAVDAVWAEYRPPSTDGQRAAEIALELIRDTLPDVISTVERSTRMSVIERDAQGMIERVTTSTIAAWRSRRGRRRPVHAGDQRFLEPRREQTAPAPLPPCGGCSALHPASHSPT